MTYLAIYTVLLFYLFAAILNQKADGHNGPNWSNLADIYIVLLICKKCNLFIDLFADFLLPTNPFQPS